MNKTNSGKKNIKLASPLGQITQVKSSKYLKVELLARVQFIESSADAELMKCLDETRITF